MNLEDTLDAKSDAIAKWLLHDRTFAHDQYDDNYQKLTGMKAPHLCVGMKYLPLHENQTYFLYKYWRIFHAFAYSFASFALLSRRYTYV